MSLIIISLIAAVTAFIIGMIWHGPLFGKAWMRHAMDANHSGKKSRKDMAVRLAINFVTNAVMAFATFLILINLHPSTVGQVFVILAVILVGFVLPMAANQSLWNGRPNRSQAIMFLVVFGYQILNFAVWGALIALLG